MSDLLASEEEVGKARNDQQILINREPMPSPWIRKGITRNGRTIDVQVDWNYKKDPNGRLIGFIAVITDISERLKAEIALRKAHDGLEERVEQRTRELLRTNDHLKKEIFERVRAEEELRVKRANLEEINTALKVLLKKR